MATKGEKKSSIKKSNSFLAYEKAIIKHEAYKNMPDVYHEDGSIQWESPSNRAPGKFQNTHDKRLKWWQDKAAEIGISTNESHWISKVAKTIHPTKQHPCQACGRIMDIRFSYLNSTFIKRVKKLPFYQNDIELTKLTHIIDFTNQFLEKYKSKGFEALPNLLKCKKINIPPIDNKIDDWIDWIDTCYIPAETSLLGPGAMANPPDRLDGFHTLNRCCRHKLDKGRSKKNLQSYATDRRAFENWSDGNWIEANKLMSIVTSNPKLQQEHCANEGNGEEHSSTLSADHIGPISLGFCHRPEFQLLCSTCNSAKNNRMYYSDVIHLKEIEKTSTQIASWYAEPIWKLCKDKVVDKDTALRLSRVMRDNRSIAFSLLYDILKHHQYLFLLSLMHLEYTNYKYQLVPDTIKINNHIVTAQFKKSKNSSKYVNTQKERKIRIAFCSLFDYGNKENRNEFLYDSSTVKAIKRKLYKKLKKIPHKLKSQNNNLSTCFKDYVQTKKIAKADLHCFVEKFNIKDIENEPIFIESKKYLILIMKIVAIHLTSNWDSDRYSREIEEHFES